MSNSVRVSPCMVEMVPLPLYKSFLEATLEAEMESIWIRVNANPRSTMGKTYEKVINSWRNWPKLYTYFRYEKTIRKMIYTTNAIEGIHRQLR